MSNILFDEFRKEWERRERKKRFNSVIQNGKDWIESNKDALITIIPVAIGSIVAVTKVIGKGVNLRKQESVKKLYCYDPSLGHYWRLKRDLSNREWLDIDRRKRNGERLADILAEMKVLK